MPGILPDFRRENPQKQGRGKVVHVILGEAGCSKEPISREFTVAFTSKSLVRQLDQQGTHLVFVQKIVTNRNRIALIFADIQHGNQFVKLRDE